MASVSPKISFENPADLRFKELDEWLAWQEGLHFTAIDLGLDRCREVAEKMGLLQFDFKVISVAGTNGKGSSVTMLDMILRRSGYATGKYTSPHLLRYNERICIDGKEVNSDLLCRSFDRIDKARGEISLTYFEFGTLAALDIFRQSNLDIIIMEVGLGGRLDAVNILDADVALVTSLDIDHERWLGSDRESIAREKAGIFRAGKPAVCSDPNPPGSIMEKARQTGTALELLNDSYHYEIQGDHWNWKSGELEYRDLAIPGPVDNYQVQNAAGVLKVLQCLANDLAVSEEAVITSMQDFHLNGRFQHVPGDISYVLDVAHNRQAASMLIDNLEKLPEAGKTHCVMGMFKDKNHENVFRELNPLMDYWYLSELDSDRAAQPDDLNAALSSLSSPVDSSIFGTVVDALEAASKRAKPGDRIVITGSFLTVKAGLVWLGLDH